MGKIRNKYLLTLYRRRIVAKKYINNEAQIKSQISDDAFFATDYFDKLKVRKIKQEDDLSVFTGIKQTDQTEEASEVIAMQNYAIYRDVTEADSSENIFEKDADHTYLGLIHVYITTDTLAKLDCSDIEEKRTDYMTAFEEDLNRTVDICNEFLHTKGAVFRMLSLSDFMIVVRGKRPEDVLSVAFAIRKKKISKKGNPGDNLYAYKTYTILTINGTGISIKYNRESPTGEVLLRCRYSNEYWRKQDKSTKQEKCNLKKPSSYRYLYGRYDFLVKISLAEFLEAFPLWSEAKGVNTNGTFEITEKNEKKYSEELNYLYNLIQQEGISYLNERYLIPPIENLSEKCSSDYKKALNYVNTAFLNNDANVSAFLFQTNNKECDEIIERIQKYDVEETDEPKYKKRIRDLKKIRPAISDSLELLINLTFLCKEINALSDARIYAISFLKQIKSVLNSFENWIEIYEIDKNVETLQIAEGYLLKSIKSLEEYGSFIRNNNFQTLQAPSYSAMNGIRMEKFLLGYSRFYNTVMDFCCEQLKKVNEGKRKYYLAAMIPRFGNDQVSVEVMFPERCCFSNTKCVSRPLEGAYFTAAAFPIEKLTDMRYIIPTLFHEMAHSIRYEKRRLRNRNIARLILEDVANTVNGHHFIIAIEPETGIKNTYAFQKIFVDALFCAFGHVLEHTKKKNSYKLPLQDFVYAVTAEIQRFLLLLAKDYDSILYQVQGLIANTNEYLTDDALHKMVDLARRIDVFTGQTDLQTRENGRKKFEEQKEKNINKLKKICKEGTRNAIQNYVTWCQKYIPKEAAHNVERLGQSLINNIENTEMLFSDEKEIIENFYEQVYEGVCSRWNCKMNEMNDLWPERKEWLKQGRAFGIDWKTENNKLEFKKHLKKAVKLVSAYELESVLENAVYKVKLYREKTADLFMCTMCELDLNGYLATFAHMEPSIDGTYLQGHIERLTDVILIQWMADPDAESFMDKKKEKRDTELCEDKLFGGLWKSLNPEEEVFPKTIEELRKSLEEYSLKGQFGKFKEDIAALAYQILDKIEDRFDWLCQRKYMLEDYLRGKNEYQKIRDEFIKCANSEKHTALNHTICEIVKMCDTNRKLLSALEIPENDEAMTRYQNQCVDFIMQNLYFDNLKNAKMEDYRYDDSSIC